MNIELAILGGSFGLSIILGLIILPILRKLKIGQEERSFGPKSHLSKEGTPTMGGIIMILTILVMGVGTAIGTHFLSEGTGVAKKMVPLLISAIGFGLVGFIDDFKKLVLKNTDGLKPRYKMLGLFIISAIIIGYMLKVLNIGTSTYIPIADIYVNLPMVIYVLFAIFVMLGTTNAVNLTDGIDGLSTSVSTIIIATLTIIGIIFNVKEIALFGAIVCGANLGFLIFNLHPAKMFMGDTGSLMLGGVIASMALYLKMPLLLILIAIIPVLETISVMLQVAYFKKTGGKRLFKMTPIHHHFELSGWSENKVCFIFSLVTLIACGIGLAIV